MKVCHVCSAHQVDDKRVFHRECVSLAAAGYDVHLIGVANPDKPGDKPYVEQGVTIHPVPKTSGRRERFSRRARLAQMAATMRPALLHVHEPELLGPVIKHAGSCPVIWDVHESYLDVLKAREWIPPYLRPLASRAWDRQERALLRRCAGVVVVTERIARRYRALHPRVEVVANYAVLSDLDLPQPPRDGKTCVFTGLLQEDRGLLQVVEALSILKGRGCEVPLVLAGWPAPPSFLERLQTMAQQLGVQDLVEYRGELSRSDAVALQNQASISLVPYLPVSNTMLSLADKLVVSMALGSPLVFSNFPNYVEIAGESGAGIAVDPTQPAEIAAALERLVRDPELARRMGEAGRRAARERFNWDVESAKLLRLYATVLEPAKKGVPAS